MKFRAIIFCERSAYQGAKTVSGRTVCPNADDDDLLSGSDFGKMQKQTMNDGGMNPWFGMGDF
ncbi:hypothetical protein HMSSN036_06210 [Paenibacillus macerans]|nr:hypothetical protein HMSSN036_06210 [Paenibacillus macerans]